ncbi:hypothetical protein SDC9_172831 [bioreactor metagenome]|uniref:Uncharacterized protein n=1 Tax=bioreactor metagenome TaxID=1076179 RepID=A0A645GHG1_9ZZZZ
MAKESRSESPRRHSVNPVGMDRQAEPEPRLARRERLDSGNSRPRAPTAANESAANAAAEEAIPAPVGKLFSLNT